MIKIHIDFVLGDEISYSCGKERKDGFNTNCLTFFNWDNGDEVVIVKKDGSYISRNELLENDGSYTDKNIRKEHNILKLFIAGKFSWKQPLIKSVIIGTEVYFRDRDFIKTGKIILYRQINNRYDIDTGVELFKDKHISDIKGIV